MFGCLTFCAKSGAGSDKDTVFLWAWRLRVRTVYDLKRAKTKQIAIKYGKYK